MRPTILLITFHIWRKTKGECLGSLSEMSLRNENRTLWSALLLGWNVHLVKGYSQRKDWVTFKDLTRDFACFSPFTANPLYVTSPVTMLLCFRNLDVFHAAIGFHPFLYNIRGIPYNHNYPGLIWNGDICCMSYLYLSPHVSCLYLHCHYHKKWKCRENNLPKNIYVYNVYCS